MCRDDLEKESVLEEIVKQGMNSVAPNWTEEVIMKGICQAMNERLNQEVMSRK